MALDPFETVEARESVLRAAIEEMAACFGHDDGRVQNATYCADCCAVRLFVARNNAQHTGEPPRLVGAEEAVADGEAWVRDLCAWKAHYPNLFK